MLYGVFIGDNALVDIADSSPFLENFEANLSAATATFAFNFWCELNRRTRHGAIRTIHTAVPRFGFQQGDFSLG